MTVFRLTAETTAESEFFWGANVDIESIHNFYEHMVFDYLFSEVIPQHPNEDEETFMDAACYALTRLPARYIRHEIDMVFYLAPGELEKMETDVKNAVEDGIATIIEHKQKSTERRDSDAQ